MTTDQLTPDETDEARYRARCAALAAMLRARPDRHDQDVYVANAPDNECGTAGCIAGWATILFLGHATLAADGTMTWDKTRYNPDKTLMNSDDPEFTPYEVHGRDWLGLSAGASSMLFHTYDERVSVELLTRLGDGRLPLNFTLGEYDKACEEFGEFTPEVV